MLELMLRTPRTLTLMRQLLLGGVGLYMLSDMLLGTTWDPRQQTFWPGVSVFAAAALAMIYVAALGSYLYLTMRTPGGLSGWRLALTLLPVVNLLWIPLEIIRIAGAVMREASARFKWCAVVTGLLAALLLLAVRSAALLWIIAGVDWRELLLRLAFVVPPAAAAVLLALESVAFAAESLPVIPVGGRRRRVQFFAIWGGGMLLLALCWVWWGWLGNGGEFLLWLARREFRWG